MEKIEKRPYEISICEDYIDENGVPKEKQIAIFGSHLMTAKSRALSPKLLRKINGEVVFTFSMMHHYWDEESMAEITNPIIKYLVNERKIKLKYKNKIYDLVIKQIDEDAEKNNFSYTAKSAWVNELSRQGYAISFSEELKNNQGTLKQLAEATLKDTDWEFDNDSHKPLQYKDCPLYKVEFNILQGKAYLLPEKTKLQDFANQKVVLFFNYNDGEINNKSILKNRQFIFSENEEYDNNQILIGQNYIFDENENITFSINYCDLQIGGKGKFLISQPITFYEKALDRYINIYCKYYKPYKGNSGSIVDALKSLGLESSQEKREEYAKLNNILITENMESTNIELLKLLKKGKLIEEKICGFLSTEYTDTVVTKDLITNGKDISSTTGWHVWDIENNKIIEEPELGIEYADESKQEIKGYIYTNKGCLVNSGIYDNFSYFKTVSKGDKYVIAFPKGLLTGVSVKVFWKSFTEDEIIDLFDSENENNTNAGIEFTYEEKTYYSSILTCLNTYTEEKLSKGKIYFLIKKLNKNQPELKVEEIQFFKLIERENADNDNRKFLMPTEINYSSVKFNQKYYKPGNYNAAEEIEYLNEAEVEGCVQQFSEDYQMIRDIKIQESNRFNIIQTLAETFEVWPEFNVTKNDDGTFKKKVSFKQYAGGNNYAGFRYGVNLKKVDRKIETDQITSKIYVKQNSNEFAPNGNCRISESEENYIREDFLFNFEYYLNQGLLDREEFIRVLYNTTDGYYYKLNEYNKDKKELNDRISQNNNTLTNKKAELETYKFTLQGIEDNKAKCVSEISSAGGNFDELLKEDWIENESLDYPDVIIKNMRQYLLFNSQEEAIKRDYSNVEENIKKLSKQIEEDRAEINDIVTCTSELHKNFHKKYSNFIQEGSWISEDYIDPNLYFLDAANVLANSATPKVTYSIEAIAIDQIPEWKNYTFNIGEKTFMEDPKFFGYITINGIKVPRKEEIIISEITEELEEQSKDKIVAQNFKTQFEDLFQRITATVETLQFKEGEYNRSASAITAQGNINNSILDKSLITNEIILRLENEIKSLKDKIVSMELKI